MRELISAGGVVFNDNGGELKLLMILDRFGHWTFPKGKVEEGENAEEAALREIREETGIGGTVVGLLGDTAYAYAHDEETIHKRVLYYLVKANGSKIIPAEAEIAGAEWVSPEEADKRCGYENNRELVKRAMDALRPAPGPRVSS